MHVAINAMVSLMVPTIKPNKRSVGLVRSPNFSFLVLKSFFFKIIQDSLVALWFVVDCDRKVLYFFAMIKKGQNQDL